jgi:hypothetical protein
MSPEDIKALRRELSCTARELAAALEVDADTVLAWERSDLFPTKRHIGMMDELRRKGPAAVPRKRKKAAALPPLADPAFWRLFRKLLAHRDLREAAEALAEAYPDPVDEPPP